jgi:hypothetical protein
MDNSVFPRAPPPTPNIVTAPNSPDKTPYGSPYASRESSREGSPIDHDLYNCRGLFNEPPKPKIKAALKGKATGNKKTSKVRKMRGGRASPPRKFPAKISSVDKCLLTGRPPLITSLVPGQEVQVQQEGNPHQEFEDEAEAEAEVAQ